ARLEGNPYKEWILEYGNEQFSSGVALILEMIDRWAETAPEELLARMDDLYLESARYEYAFWNYGYTGTCL
ncbi:MAG: hypothetical protein MR414_02370, partial [Bacteroidales bacterium]|nr:hypothetical protein [Bacteroidales bacterium]